MNRSSIASPTCADMTEILMSGPLLRSQLQPAIESFTAQERELQHTAEYWLLKALVVEIQRPLPRQHGHLVSDCYAKASTCDDMSDELQFASAELRCQVASRFANRSSAQQSDATRLQFVRMLERARASLHDMERVAATQSV